jgi:hypothetical protein
MKNVQVVRDDGTSGRVLADANAGRTIVEFEDGEVVVVPAEALVPQTDGTHRLKATSDVTHATERELVIPVIAEELTMETERVARGRVRVNKRIETSEETVQTPTIQKEVSVDRIPINQFVDTPPAVHEVRGVVAVKTVIGLFDDRNEAMRAYSALVHEGYAKADLDILTSDDKDDEPKLAHMRDWVPAPDVNIYLEGVRTGGTVRTAKFVTHVSNKERKRNIDGYQSDRPNDE